MKRREAFKKIGLFTIIGGSGLAFLSSCKNEESKEVIAAPLAALSTPKAKTEREKLIINRSFNTFADPKNPTKAELKHTPEIILGEKDSLENTLVKITIGQAGIIHPATKQHWVDYIKVFVNDKLVAETEFANGGIRGFGHYYLALNQGDKIIAEAGCNLHGIYESGLNI